MIAGRPLLLATLWVLTISAATLQAGFTQIVAFGDSLTDTGNVYDLLGDLVVGPPNYQGRFSNGPIYVERLAERLGIAPPTASRTGGTNYAYGGAQTGTGNSSFVIPNISTQVNTYIASLPLIDSGQLFVLYGGSNDFISNQNNPSIPISNLSSNIAALSAQGATNFLVPNLPPLGATPGSLGSVNESRLNDLSIAFNIGLAAELSRLESTMGINIYRLDTFGLVQDALANPSAYGLTNVTQAAYNSAAGSVVPNPNEYLFWDTQHPTATGHRLLGDRAFASVPEPTLVGLMPLLIALSRFAPRNRR